MTPLLLAGSALWPAASRAQPGAPAPVVSAGGNADLNYYAEYYATDASAAGKVTTSVQYTIIYQ